MRRDALDRARPKSGWWERRSIAAALLLVVLLPALGVGGWYLWQVRSTHEFETARGEQRVIVLPDG